MHFLYGGWKGRGQCLDIEQLNTGLHSMVGNGCLSHNGPYLMGDPGPGTFFNNVPCLMGSPRARDVLKTSVVSVTQCTMFNGKTQGLGRS